MDWVDGLLRTLERWVVAGVRWGQAVYFTRRPWKVEIVPTPGMGYLPPEYIGTETPFQLRNCGPLDVVDVYLVVKLGGRLADGRVPIADINVTPAVAAGEASAMTSFPDMDVGKTRTGRVTWLDSRGPHRQRVRIRSIGTYDPRW